MSSPFPGPVPPYNNPPINPQYYEPRVFDIEDVQLGSFTNVFTVMNHDYVIGQEVRLLIPYYSGCRQLNQMTGEYIIPPNQQAVNLVQDSTSGNSGYVKPILISINSIYPLTTIIPNTLSLYFGRGTPGQTLLKDDGEGNVIYQYGTYTLSSGLIDYTNGRLILNFSFTPPAMTSVTTSFTYNIGLYPDIVSVNIDSSENVDQFISTTGTTQPQIVAIGDVNNGIISSTGQINSSTNIPGAFINISPQ